MEYKCEVKEILSPEEFRDRKLVSTPFPRKPTSGSDITPGSGAGSDGVTSCDKDWKVYVVLTNGAVFGCDLIISATGVTPSVGAGLEVLGGKLTLAGDGGVAVDQEMRTNLNGVYAAGDICSAQWGGHSDVWFQV